MPVHIGTCSWNYDSWVGPVYSKPREKAVEYLAEYSSRYRMVDVDSWFYRLPARRNNLGIRYPGMDPGWMLPGLIFSGATILPMSSPRKSICREYWSCSKNMAIR